MKKLKMSNDKTRIGFGVSCILNYLNFCQTTQRMNASLQPVLNVADFVPGRFRPTSNFDRFRPQQISSHF